MAPLVFIGVMVFAVNFIERSWRDKIPSPQRAGWIKRYCLPVSEKRFARKMQRTLDWNPIAWLQQYSWKARLSKWGLSLPGAIVLMDCAATATGSLTDLQAVQGPVLLILAAVYTFVGVKRSFLNEKKVGRLGIDSSHATASQSNYWREGLGLVETIPAGGADAPAFLRRRRVLAKFDAHTLGNLLIPGFLESISHFIVGAKLSPRINAHRVY